MGWKWEKGEGDTSAEPTLIGGKYKTVEEAEKALGEGARKITEQGTELSRKDQELAAARAQSTRQATQDQGALDQEDEALAQALLTKPKQVFAQWAQAVSQSMSDYVPVAINSALMVDRFLSKNALAQEHPRLFNACLRETDPKKSLPERLEDALGMLNEDLGKAQAQGKKNAKAEDAAKKKVTDGVTGGDEGGGEEDLTGKKKVDDDDSEDTPETAFNARRSQFEKLKTLA